MDQKTTEETNTPNNTPTTLEVPTAAPEVTVMPQSEQPESMFSKYKPFLALVLGIAISVGGYAAYDHYTEPIAAKVNGAKITQAELAESVQMMMKGAELQGIDVTDEAVRTEITSQALTNLINNELLLGAARKSGVSTNEAAVQTAYDSLVTEVGGEEELKSRMETVGLSLETLRGNIGDRLMVDEYIETETDIETITVTDEEITAYLSTIQTEGITLPPLEEIRPQIEASLIAERQQAIVDALIEKLRSEATIEIKE